VTRTALALVIAAAGACGGGGGAATAPAAGRRASAATLPAMLHEVALPAAPAGVPDGDDDGAPDLAAIAALATAPALRFERIEPAAGAHPRVCDIVGLGDAVYVATAVDPIALDGAHVDRYDPAARAWERVLDWDRGGSAGVTHEVGGQGFTRLRVIADRLWATDADAPEYGGFGLVEPGLEDYLFVSDTSGRFGPLSAGKRPPGGTRVVTLSFHVLDVITYAGAVIATGGTVDATRAGGTPYPGGVFVGDVDAPVFRPRFFPGAGFQVGVVRTTTAHRFGGRLHLGLQNNERKIRWDVAVLTGDPRAPAAEPPVLARLTDEGGWITRRFASGGGRLFWIGARGGKGAVFASRDGLRFERLALPAGAGEPQDLLVANDTRWLLATSGLWRATGADDTFVRVADAPPDDAFGRGNAFCSAPLAAAGGTLWAGSTRDGALYRIVTTPRS
jgi:hypothetical protein